MIDSCGFVGVVLVAHIRVKSASGSTALASPPRTDCEKKLKVFSLLSSLRICLSAGRKSFLSPLNPSFRELSNEHLIAHIGPR
jgi:hypothetical protein